jgi:colanic acid biosynthesis protein WcaH
MHHYDYCEKPIEIVQEVDAEIYQAFVANMPIVCVDIFIYCPKRQAYLMVKRSQEPAKEEWWYPGGRMWKGESFEATAQRKCSDEVGISEVSIEVLDQVYNTIFPRSAWGCPTQTFNVIALAVLDKDQEAKLDPLHEEYRWVPIEEKPEKDYLRSVYDQVLMRLRCAVQPAS